MSRLLIDGDMIVYRSCVAVEKDTRFEDRYHILMSDEEDAWYVFENTLADLTDLAYTDDVLFCFSDPNTTFRKQWFPELYKDNRKAMRKPLAYWDVKKRIEESFPTDERPLLEADDLLGILATSNPGDIIWSLDKDLKQIPALHLFDDEIVEISEEEGDLFFYAQTIAGDVTDGYKGAEGFGMTSAERLLRNKLKYASYEHELTRGPRKGQTEIRWKEVDAETPWETVTSVFEKAGQTEQDALMNAQMAKILRANDYVNGEIKRWTPTSTQ
ncbi:hypothetical protein [Maritalea mediterranea]|uniref:5'-3' exonuclease domain-containing protein n=1 Tax=Maritalea mediterranea TaxID=2909667 RepID=A0ABS9EA89_9HYPH|nr:hypothetical protein [Maritalea mediterranea]MCF4099801.1 hypothetical protein [Maritalea mediterranea]